MVVLTSFSQPTEGIRHRQNNITVYVNDNNLGKGTLYIAESNLSWVSDSGNGFSIEYPHISLHAVSRDLSAFPQECLFLMLDGALGDEEINNGDGENDSEDENNADEEETTELRLVPDDRGMLDAMFHAMNACQALHPDPEDSISDEDFYEDADDEIPIEEADSRMAGLLIESMDGRRHMMGRGMAECLAWGGMGEDMVEDRAGGRAEDMDGMNCILEDMVEDKAEDRVGGRVGGMAGRNCTSAGISYNISEGILGEGTVGGILGRFDTEGGMAEGVGSTLASGMDQDDRPFSLGSMRPQGRTAVLLVEHSPHKDPEEDSNFADAEN